MSRFSRRLIVLCTALILVPLVTLGPASPAAAASCRTAGHAYLIYNGGVYFSGYEGNYQFGIQYLVLPRGTAFEGIYQMRVNYRAGRTGAPISETEVFIIFI
jgi:hypothetical protein